MGILLQERENLEENVDCSELFKRHALLEKENMSISKENSNLEKKEEGEK